MEMDYGVGRVLDFLEKNNLKENTFVYFSSDNGGHLEEVGIDGEQEGGFNGIYKGEFSIKQVLALDYTQRLKEGIIVRLKLSKLRLQRLGLSWLRSSWLRLSKLKSHRLRLSGSEAGVEGQGQGEIIYSSLNSS